MAAFLTDGVRFLHKNQNKLLKNLRNKPEKSVMVDHSAA